MDPPFLAGSPVRFFYRSFLQFWFACLLGLHRENVGGRADHRSPFGMQLRNATSLEKFITLKHRLYRTLGSLGPGYAGNGTGLSSIRIKVLDFLDNIVGPLPGILQRQPQILPDHSQSDAGKSAKKHYAQHNRCISRHLNTSRNPCN
jgi:hypothetical protein